MSSYSTLSSCYVIQACDKCLNAYDEHVKELLHEMIVKNQRRWFFKHLTYEESKAHLEIGDIWSEYNMTKKYASSAVIRVQQLRKLAKVSTHVNVCADDFDIIAPYYTSAYA